MADTLVKYMLRDLKGIVFHPLFFFTLRPR